MYFGQGGDFRKWEVRAERDIARRFGAIEIFFRGASYDGNHDAYIKKIELGYFDPEKPYVRRGDYESIELGEDLAQTLMDELWRCGLRPTEGHGSAGAFAEVKGALEDTRKIRDRLLVLVENKF